MYVHMPEDDDCRHSHTTHMCTDMQRRADSIKYEYLVIITHAHMHTNTTYVQGRFNPLNHDYWFFILCRRRSLSHKGPALSTLFIFVYMYVRMYSCMYMHIYSCLAW